MWITNLFASPGNDNPAEVPERGIAGIDLPTAVPGAGSLRG